MKKLAAIIICAAMCLNLMACEQRLPSGSDPSTDTDLTPQQMEEILAEIEAGTAELE